MVVVEWGEHCSGEVSTLVCQLWPNLAATRVAKKTVWTEIENVQRKKNYLITTFAIIPTNDPQYLDQILNPAQPSLLQQSQLDIDGRSHHMCSANFHHSPTYDDLCQELHATGLLLNSRVGFDCHICYLTLQTVKCLLHIACDIIKTLSNVNFLSEYYDISIIVDDSWSPNSTDLYFWYSFVNIQIRKT